MEEVTVKEVSTVYYYILYIPIHCWCIIYFTAIELNWWNILQCLTEYYLIGPLFKTCFYCIVLYSFWDLGFCLSTCKCEITDICRKRINAAVDIGLCMGGAVLVLPFIEMYQSLSDFFLQIGVIQVPWLKIQTVLIEIW